jgi:hypothetical protein
MSNQPVTLTYEVDLRPGEALALPSDLTANLAAGRWLITIQAIADTDSSQIRDHSAFLNSYAPEDEGLYDDYTR